MVSVGEVEVGEETTTGGVVVTAVVLLEVTIGQSVNTKDVRVTTSIGIHYLLDYDLEVECLLLCYSRHHYRHTPFPSEYRYPS